MNKEAFLFKNKIDICSTGFYYWFDALDFIQNMSYKFLTEDFYKIEAEKFNVSAGAIDKTMARAARATKVFLKEKYNLDEKITTKKIFMIFKIQMEVEENEKN